MWRTVCLVLLLVGGCSFVRSHQVREQVVALPRIPLEAFAREGAGSRREFPSFPEPLGGLLGGRSAPHACVRSALRPF